MFEIYLNNDRFQINILFILHFFRLFYRFQNERRNGKLLKKDLGPSGIFRHALEQLMESILQSKLRQIVEVYILIIKKTTV